MHRFPVRQALTLRMLFPGLSALRRHRRRCGVRARFNSFVHALEAPVLLSRVVALIDRPLLRLLCGCSDNDRTLSDRRLARRRHVALAHHVFVPQHTVLRH